jgi:hypothetical protein
MLIGGKEKLERMRDGRADRFERWWSTPTLAAVERLKVYKIVRDFDRLGIRRPPHALRAVLCRQFDHCAQPERPRSALGCVPRHDRRAARRIEPPA